MNKPRIVPIFIIVVTLGVIYSAFAYDLPKWFPFNYAKALDEWQEKIFRGRVLYRVDLKKTDSYLFAKSEKTSSGLLYKFKFDVIKFPMISWEWKVNTFPDKRNVPVSKEGWVEQDDYAARVYVIFLNWNFMNIKSLEYIWDEHYPEGTVITSPYFKNIKLFVIESGKKNLGSWVSEERNIAQDYRKAFGQAPPRYAGAIALMTDADNSLSTAEASYKNIKVGYKK